MNPDYDELHMQRALQLAAKGEGHVEPNPQVGCVIAKAGDVVCEGWHELFGGPHAEVNALRRLPSEINPTELTLYVTLEPCCHFGKTPPCTEAIIRSGIRRIVVSSVDPFPAVSGRGLQMLQEAGCTVVSGICAAQGRELLAPFRKLQVTQKPWVIAKWAMTLDGKLATATGDSQWISNEQSRAVVHRLRGRMDAILVGSQTAITDNPRLTARPPGPRVPLRCVFDSQARLAEHLHDCRLSASSAEFPVAIFTSVQADVDRLRRLESAGFEIVTVQGKEYPERIRELLEKLGRRKCTNLLVEGGAGLFGLLMDTGELDEAHAFIAPKLVGGQDAPSAFHGAGVKLMKNAPCLEKPEFQILSDNIYVHGRVRN